MTKRQIRRLVRREIERRMPAQHIVFTPRLLPKAPDFKDELWANAHEVAALIAESRRSA